MSRPWRLAESLKQLRVQVNGLWPHRDKSSDGAIGDAGHASRSSDHNPWMIDHNGIGVVTAIDIDADLEPNLNVAVLRDALLASRDPRIKYIIHNRQIYASYPVGGVGAWKPRPYHGANAHQHHMHISVNASPMLYDSTAPWTIAVSGEEETPQIQKPREVAAAEPVVIPPTNEVPANPAEMPGATADESAELPAENTQPPAPKEEAGGILGQYQKIGSRVDEASDALNTLQTRKDGVKALWSTVGHFVFQPFWAVFAFFEKMPLEMWIGVAVFVALTYVLYHHRQFVLGKIRDLATWGMGPAASEVKTTQ